jgi:hypothetical protein
MHMNAENKLFLTCKTSNFFKKSLFLFKYDKIFQAAILQNFHSDFRATYVSNCTEKLIQQKLLSELLT